MQRAPILEPTYHSLDQTRQWTHRKAGIAVLLAGILVVAGSFDTLAKPPRPGMGGCTVGDLTAIVGISGQSFLDQCTVGGGTMYCDNTGYACCKTSANGVEICSGADWDQTRNAPIKRAPQMTPVPGEIQ